MKTRILTKDLENRGIIGDVTDMTYSNGEPMQVGDVVVIRSPHTLYDVRIVLKLEDKYYISGLYYSTFKKGMMDAWNMTTVTLKKKFYDLKVGEIYDGIIVSEMNPSIKPKKIIVINGKSIEISEESFNEFKKTIM